MTRILFVCYGNICRSPIAEGVLASRANGLDLKIDSAGISDWHEGKPPDPRAQAICAKHDIDISMQRSRPICVEDFHKFDLILAMDRHNLAGMEEMKPKKAKAKIGLLLDYAPDLKIDEVPDPYYDQERGFAKVLAMIEHAAEGLMQELNSASRSR